MTYGSQHAARVEKAGEEVPEVADQGARVASGLPLQRQGACPCASRMFLEQPATAVAGAGILDEVLKNANCLVLEFKKT